MAHKPEHTDPENVPKRSKAELDPEEREFWELDGPPADAPPRATEVPPSPAEPVPELPVPSGSPPTPREEPPLANEPTLSDERPEPEEEEEAAAPAPESKSTGSRRRVSATEIVSLAVLGLVLVAGAIWALGQFFEAIPTDDPEVAIDFPVKGTAVELASVETYWRRPDATKDVGVRRGTVLAPAATVTLQGGGDYALRFFFENETGSIVGDPRTIAVAGGRFDGADQTEIFGTAGFDNEGNFAAYLAGTLEHWYLVITEGPGVDASGREFKEILRIPISRSTR